MEYQLLTREVACFTAAAMPTSEERFSADAVVPDTLPDAERLLDAWGELSLWRLDVNDGSAELEGEIRCDVLYQDEAGGLQSFPVQIPVLLRLRDAALEPGLRPCLELTVTELTPQLMNTRKIRLAARVRAVLTAWRPDTLTLTESAEGEDVCQRRTRVCFQPVTAVEEQVFTAYGTAAMTAVPDRILARRSEVCLDEVQCMGEKLILQGRVRVHLLSCAPEPAAETLEIPFSQLIDTLAPTEITAAQIQVHLTSVTLRPLQEEQSLEIEAHLAAQAVCRGSAEAEVLTDAYSNRTLLDLETETLTLPMPGAREQLRVTAEAELACDTADRSVMVAHAALRGPGTAEATVLRRDESGQFSALRQELRYEAPEDCAVCSAAAGTLSVTPTAEGLQLRLPVTLETERRETLTLTQITALTGDAPNEAAAAMPSVTLLRREDAPDLWEIAKSHASTVEAIRAANPEDTERTYLVVPKAGT